MKNLEKVLFYDTKNKTLFNADSMYDGLEPVFKGKIPRADFIPVKIETIDNRHVNLRLDDVGVFEGRIEKDKTRECDVFIRDRYLGDVYFTLKVFKHWNNYAKYQFVEADNGDIMIEEMLINI